jgi:glycosyltransferase involved in cell wall biosynthesis
MAPSRMMIDPGLLQACRAVLPLQVLVRSRPRPGEKVDVGGSDLETIYSLGASGAGHASAAAGHTTGPPVRDVPGPPVDSLARLAPELRGRSTLFWLDARSSLEEPDPGAGLRLLAEIAAIGALGLASVVVIDDAHRLLVPPPPGKAATRPSLDAVWQGLRGLSADHRLGVLDDRIVFFPPRLADALGRYADERARDAKPAGSGGSAEERMLGDLEEKEREIHSLAKVAQERERVLEEKEREIDSLAAIASRRQRALEEQAAALSTLSERLQTTETQLGQLLERDRQIEAGRPVNRIKNFWVPRIGSLDRHGPIPLRVPRRYRRLRSLRRTPVVSIVTPSFNQPEFVEATIRSVLEQRYPALEYIVQDGGSSAETLATIEGYRDRLFYWESRPDGGQAHALNLGFGRSSGEIMAYLNSDDLLLPGALHYVVHYLNRHPEVDVVYGQRVLIDANDFEINRWVLPPHDDAIVPWVDFIPQETLFWRRRIWERVGGRFDEALHFAIDWDLILRFREVGARFVRLPRFLGAFRVHPAQKTMAEAGTGQEEVERLRRRYLGRDVDSREILDYIRPYLRRHIVCQKLYRAGLFRY